MTLGDWLNHMADPHPMWDLVRLVISFNAFMVFVMTVRMAAGSRHLPDRDGRTRRTMWLLSYAFILLVVAIGQLERLGQPLRWTVPPLFAGTLLGVLALRRDFRLRVPRHLPGADRGRRRRP